MPQLSQPPSPPQEDDLHGRPHPVGVAGDACCSEPQRSFGPATDAPQGSQKGGSATSDCFDVSACAVSEWFAGPAAVVFLLCAAKCTAKLAHVMPAAMDIADADNSSSWPSPPRPVCCRVGSCSELNVSTPSTGSHGTRVQLRRDVFFLRRFAKRNFGI